MKKRVIYNKFKDGSIQATVKQYNHHDIINYDCTIGKRIIPYVDLVLRKRIDSSTHGKKIYLKSMAIEIFYLYIKLIIKYLLQGETLELEKLGVLRLKTYDYSPKYKDKYLKVANRNIKNRGVYTVIHVKFYRRFTLFRYGRPTVTLGSHYKKLIREKENTGFKY